MKNIITNSIIHQILCINLKNQARISIKNQLSNKNDLGTQVPTHNIKSFHLPLLIKNVICRYVGSPNSSANFPKAHMGISISSTACFTAVINRNGALVTVNLHTRSSRRTKTALCDVTLTKITSCSKTIDGDLKFLCTVKKKLRRILSNGDAFRAHRIF